MQEGVQMWENRGQRSCGHGRKAGNEGFSENMETRRRDYNQARGDGKRAIFKAKKFCEDLEREDEKGNLFICLGWPSNW